MIEERLEGSGFVLTVETEESVGYRCGVKADLLRALYIHLERRTVEYELTVGGALTRNGVEHFETIGQLLERLPKDAASFDIKFQGLRLEAEGAAGKMPSRPNPRAYATEDPWDLTNYRAQPRGEKAHPPTRLRLAD